MGTTTSQRTPIGRWADRIEDATPADRDRAIDVLRAGCVLVVVAWHWAGSITHWGDRGLSMPNPLDEIPLGWAFTWVLQVMPLFFVVGGWANHRTWNAARRRGDGGLRFARDRALRLTRPLVPLLVAWAVFDLVVRAFRPDYDGVLSWGFVVFVPLWFIAVYAVVTALTPLTTAMVDRAGLGAPVLVLGAVAVIDAARFAGDVPGVGWVNGLLVFVAAQLLGHVWSAGLVDRRLAAICVGVGVTTMWMLSTFGPYPPSLVATGGQEFSNMRPANAMVGGLVLVQTGLAVLAAPTLRRAARGVLWASAVVVNLLAMTVFTWHMTALVGFIGLLEVAGFGLEDEATRSWWLTRPLWIIGPGVLLAGLIAVFGRAERPAPSPSSTG